MNVFMTESGRVFWDWGCVEVLVAEVPGTAVIFLPVGFLSRRLRKSTVTMSSPRESLLRIHRFHWEQTARGRGSQENFPKGIGISKKAKRHWVIGGELELGLNRANGTPTLLTTSE